eukprot:Nk52_evm2s7 gene=Nk52_evmTU2s7
MVESFMESDIKISDNFSEYGPHEKATVSASGRPIRLMLTAMMVFTVSQYRNDPQSTPTAEMKVEGRSKDDLMELDIVLQDKFNRKFPTKSDVYVWQSVVNVNSNVQRIKCPINKDGILCGTQYGVISTSGDISTLTKPLLVDVQGTIPSGSPVVAELELSCIAINNNQKSLGTRWICRKMYLDKRREPSQLLQAEPLTVESLAAFDDQ